MDSDSKDSVDIEGRDGPEANGQACFCTSESHDLLQDFKFCNVQFDNA